ncbi:hypothetical protein F5Y18DRAFT_399050 [Xylariaceae sp. FL1019]|nr:hypothetical protein F5Y18DRAFT_399050 [Xylariaceae sp. FL1019]
MTSVDRTMDLLKKQPHDGIRTPMEGEPLEMLVDADDEQCMIEEATVLNAKDLKTKEVMIEPPTIPQRNMLRTSRLLANLKLNSIKSATQSLNTTHSLYLSSEEDASSSADDFSDYDYESSNEEFELLPESRSSQEVTARAVSVVFVGKPSVVNLTTARRSLPSTTRPQSEFFSSAFDSPPLEARPTAPQRKFSLASTLDIPKQTAAFLNQDPFASSPYLGRSSTMIEAPASSSAPYPRSPRTSSGAFHRLQKSISLVRKRSRANLKAEAHRAASMSNFEALNDSQVTLDSPRKPEATSPVAAIRPQSPVTYNEILRSARRNSIVKETASMQSQPASSPLTPVGTPKRGILSGLNMNRRRSMRTNS